MFVSPQLRRFWVLLVVALCVVPSLALAAPLETDLGDRLQTALSGQGGSMQLAYLLAFPGRRRRQLDTVRLSAHSDHDWSVRCPRSAPCPSPGSGRLLRRRHRRNVHHARSGRRFGRRTVWHFFATSPWVIVPVAVFFLLMAASMFGAFELSLPNELQGKLSQVGGQRSDRRVLMGLVAGIVAAPCTVHLAALLLFVSTQRSVLLGGSLLFVYAIGMGMLFSPSQALP